MTELNCHGRRIDTMKLAELAQADGTALASLVRKKEVTPLELVDAAIERIERINGALNAVITPMYDQARAAAQAPLPEGLFRGIPYLLKDVLGAYAGVRHTWGSAFLREHIATHDSELVVRLKRAGLVVVGKTNACEFGILPTTEPRLFGPTRNPWNLERTAGGSSGGAAAAVASGMIPMAHGNDGGGSIRMPASCCGLFGLKPTRARNPLGPDLGDALGGLVAEHALTRSVRDSAALLDATGGPDVGDPYWAPPPAGPFRDEVGRDPGQLRIALVTQAATGVPVNSDCVAAGKDAASLCSSLSHIVEEASPAFDGQHFSQAFVSVFAAGVAASIEGAASAIGRRPTPEYFEPLTWAVYEMGKEVSGSVYILAQTLLQRMAREVARFMLKYDAILTPTLAEPPVPLGTFDSPPENPLAGLLRATQFVAFTPLANATGQPAMSVPLYWNAENLPIGVQFVGRFGDEATLFRLAAQLEQARPWDHRRPPVSTF
jgi:amidase